MTSWLSWTDEEELHFYWWTFIVMAVNLLSVNSGGQARSLGLTEQCAIIITSNRYYVRSMFDLSFKEHGKGRDSWDWPCPMCSRPWAARKRLRPDDVVVVAGLVQRSLCWCGFWWWSLFHAVPERWGKAKPCFIGELRWAGWNQRPRRGEGITPKQTQSMWNEKKNNDQDEAYLHWTPAQNKQVAHQRERFIHSTQKTEDRPGQVRYNDVDDEDALDDWIWNVDGQLILIWVY